MIVGDIHNPPDNLYLIHSGNCKVVREITMFQRESLYGSKKLMLPPIDYNKRDVNRTNEKVIKKYLTIHILKKGDAFGVGEDLKKTFVVSIGRVSDTQTSYGSKYALGIFYRSKYPPLSICCEYLLHVANTQSG